MRVDFVKPELQKLDSIKSDALTLCLLQEDWPLRGTPGLVDWRVSGHLSRLRESGWITCDRGEIVLMPLGRRLHCDKLLLVGMGSTRDFDEAGFVASLHELFTALGKLRAHATVMHVPSRPELLGPERSMELLLDVVADHPDHAEIVVVEPVDIQDAMKRVYDARFSSVSMD